MRPPHPKTPPDGAGRATDTTPCMALLRGINVGRAKRIAMADLRELLTDLGLREVRTLLNSGNALFLAPHGNTRQLASSIEGALRERHGFAVPVVVLTAADLQAVIAANPLPQAALDASKFLVAFACTDGTLAGAAPLREQSWAPDALALGERAAYLWCAQGVTDSRLAQAFTRATADAVTTRNWATVLKLQAAVTGLPHS